MQFNTLSTNVRTHTNYPRYTFRNILPICANLAFIFLLFGCASSTKETFNDNDIYESDIGNINEISYLPSHIDKTKQKSIFVFMDGTANNPSNPSEATNIYRLFKEIEINNDSNTVAYYIEGVGNAKSTLAGKAAGFGMQDRILRGYTFITQQYRPGDKIYLFGFSRGAHTARALAGLISYAGIPVIDDHEKNKETLTKIGEGILKLTYDIHDSDSDEGWQKWKSGDNPLLFEKIYQEKINGKTGQKVQAAEVEFLGVWDTVPGSIFKTYLDCKEKIGFFKRNFSRLPGISEGERYKADSYPAIHYIAHAVSKDEKRDMFKPLLLCAPINPDSTRLKEVVFPGAHADVGGGYPDKNNQLPDISLNWMTDLLAQQKYNFRSKSHNFINASNPEAKGLAHLSISDPEGSIGSDCSDRNLDSIIPDPSIKDRNDAGAVPWVVFEMQSSKVNPDKSCINKLVNLLKEVKQENIECIEQSKIMCADLKSQGIIK